MVTKVECITWPNGDLLIVNEEGKSNARPLKRTLLWRMTFTKDNGNRIRRLRCRACDLHQETCSKKLGIAFLPWP